MLVGRIEVCWSLLPSRSTRVSLDAGEAFIVANTQCHHSLAERPEKRELRRVSNSKWSPQEDLLISSRLSLESEMWLRWFRRRTRICSLHIYPLALG